MNSSHLEFHHFGLAVRRPDEGRKYLTTLGYEIGAAVFDPGQNVHLQLCTHPGHPPVELVWPGSASGPVDKLAQRHVSGIIYHLCYQTSNLAAALAGFEQAGLNVICISPPQPAPLFGGRPVSFYNVVGMGLIEILE